MIRRPPRSTLDRSSAASDVYKRQLLDDVAGDLQFRHVENDDPAAQPRQRRLQRVPIPVSYTHLRAHETVLDLVCRLLLEKKKNNTRFIDTNVGSTMTDSYYTITV